MNTGSATYARRATTSARRAGHPIHPPLTDVTIGAYTFAATAAVFGKLDIARQSFAQAWWLALLAAGGAIGGSLVYVHGMRVQHVLAEPPATRLLAAPTIASAPAIRRTNDAAGGQKWHEPIGSVEHGV
jgi:uncharacterized membrane protein